MPESQGIHLEVIIFQNFLKSTPKLVQCILCSVVPDSTSMFNQCYFAHWVLGMAEHKNVFLEGQYHLCYVLPEEYLFNLAQC